MCAHCAQGLECAAFVVAIHQPYSKLWRVAFVRRCRVEWAGSTREAVCCNISADGVYIVVHPIPAVGERGGELREAHKVHSLPPGCGLRFLALPESDRERVVDLVKEYREPGPRRLGGR